MSRIYLYSGMILAFISGFAADAAVGNLKQWIGVVVITGLISIQSFISAAALELASDIAKELKKKE